MIITDSFHNDIEGKDYKYGSSNKIDDKSKPIILYYFLDDYNRVWDEGNPLNYDDEKLKNNASVSLIDYTDGVLLINLFDYESFDEISLKFEVGKETSIPDVVDENDHSKEYKFTTTKIVVANGLEKDTEVFEEIVTSIWGGYYAKAKEGEKLPKVAENVQNAESYKKCAECSDSVFGLEEEICFECSSFGAETTMTVEHKDGSRYRYSETDPIYGEMGEIVGHVSEITDEKDTPYQKIYGRDVTREHNFYLDAETFEANAKTGNKVYIITRRCEDYSEYRELDVAGFGSSTEARKKFNLLFKEAKENNYSDDTIADAKSYMRWGDYWGIMSFNDDGMIYELRELIIGDRGDFYFDAETFNADSTSRFIPVEVMKYDDWWVRRFGRKYNPQDLGNAYNMSYVVLVRDIVIAEFDTQKEAENHANTIRTAISVLGGMTPSKIDHPLALKEMDGYKDKNIRGGMNMAETFESESDCREAKEEVKKLRRKIALLDKLHDKDNALHHEILGSGGFFKEHELKGLFSEKDLKGYEYYR